MPEPILLLLAELKLQCTEAALELLRCGLDFPRAGQDVDPAWSRAADEYCRRLARGQAEPPTPEVAAALFPRLTMALGLHATAGDPAADETLLEWLLVTMWHRQWKGRWMAEDFRQKDDRSYEGDLPPGPRPR